MSDKVIVSERWQGEYKKWRESFYLYESSMICRLIEELGRAESNLDAIAVALLGPNKTYQQSQLAGEVAELLRTCVPRGQYDALTEVNATLQAENLRLKAPVSDEEKKFLHKYGQSADWYNSCIASRVGGKEGKG
jgi:hypothetical protein